MSLEQFLEIMDDSSTEMPSSAFHEVSDLSPEEMGQFARAWLDIPEERQLEIVSTMAQLAEENAELDFTAVFKMCLRISDDDVLEAAIEGLWEHEDRSIIPALVEVLLSTRGTRVRVAAAVGLGKFPLLAQEGKLLAKDGELVHRSLMDTLEDDDEDITVRRRCLESVAPFNTEAIQNFVEWAYSSEDEDLKSSSIYAMGRTGEAAWPKGRCSTVSATATATLPWRTPPRQSWRMSNSWKNRWGSHRAPDSAPPVRLVCQYA